MTQFKDKLMKDILSKDLSSFAQGNSSLYLSALTNDCERIEQNYLRTIFTLIQLSIMFIGSLSLMLYFSPILTLISLLVSILPMIFAMKTATILATTEKKVSEENANYLAQTKDILNGISIIKSFKAEMEADQLYQQGNHRLERQKRDREHKSLQITGLGEFTKLLAQFVVMLSGVWLVLYRPDTLTPGMAIAFTNLMNFVLQPIATIPQLLGQRKAAIVLLDKLANQIKQVDKDQGVTLSAPLNRGFTLQDISFSYKDSGDVWALADINLELELGKSYAIVGGSGSGKTSLINLLMGLYDTYQGSLSLNNIEVREITTSSLYDVMSLIQQSVFIFDASIVENITMFRNFPQSDIDRVIQLAGLVELIESHGQDYNCGENGCNLSGGEKQRIAIARSLLQESEILLVDEATSALDNQTAANITQAILDLSGLMRIVVTHRLEEKFLQQYDQIVVLKEGKLIEQGTFNQQMAEKKYFYSLFTVAN